MRSSSRAFCCEPLESGRVLGKKESVKQRCLQQALLCDLREISCPREPFNEWAPWSAKTTLNVRGSHHACAAGPLFVSLPCPTTQQARHFTSLSQGLAGPRPQLARYHDALSSSARHSPRMTRGTQHAMSRRLPAIRVCEAQSLVLVSVDLPSPEPQQRRFSPRDWHANLMLHGDNHLSLCKNIFAFAPCERSPS